MNTPFRYDYGGGFLRCAAQGQTAPRLIAAERTLHKDRAGGAAVKSTSAEVRR